MAKFEAVSYLRVSGKGQVEGDGFPRQRSAVAAFAKARGLELVGEYRDEGVSGTTDGFDRPGLADLFVRIRSNGVRIVIVERADRLARDLMVGEVILGEFRKLGVTVWTADGQDLTAGDDNPTAVLIRQILGAVAQFDKTCTVQKLRAARIRARRSSADGRCEGVRPFGENEEERAAIAKLKVLARKPRGGKRLSWAAIAEEANKAGIPTRTGAPWSRVTVERVVSRESKKGAKA